MKIIFEFDTDNEDHIDEHQLMCSAKGMSIALHNYLEGYLRNKIKYEDMSEEVYNALWDSRSHLLELLRDNGVNNDIY